MKGINDKLTHTIVVDPSKANIITQAYELYARNNSRLEDVSEFFAQNGVFTRSGRLFSKDKTKDILCNPFYYGHFRYGGDIHEGKHKPIVTKKLFDRVQQVLKLRGKPMPTDRIIKPFTGLLHCGQCGMMITAEVRQKFYPGTNRHAIYTYYRCTRKSKTISCTNPYCREESIDNQLTEEIKKFFLTDKEATWMQKKLDLEDRATASQTESVVASKQKDIGKLNTQLKFITDSFMDQVLDRNSYLQKKEELMSKRKTLQEQIEATSRQQHNWLEPMREWIKEAEQSPQIADSNDLFAKKSQVLKIFGSNLSLNHGVLHGEAQNPWAALCAAPTGRNLAAGLGFGPR